MNRIHRLTLLTAATGAAVLLAAGPAAAHVEVESANAQALARNVEIGFDAESESDSAGISEIRVVLPEGLAPADVSYGEGPKGWEFTVTDDGYTVKGPTLKTGADADYSIVVKQLPDAEELVFKMLQTYGDGRTDRWIGLDESDENPAPVLKLKAAAAGATPIGTPSPSASASAPASEPATPTPDATGTSTSTAAGEDEKDEGLSAGAWAGIAAGVLVVAGAAAFLVQRRRAVAGE